MSWKRVTVIARVGTEFGVVSDGKGDLVLVTRRPGEEWPHGVKPLSGMNQIAPGYTRYTVEKDVQAPLSPVA